MNTENTSFTAQQSLELITRMIDQAKGNVQRNAFYFLFWGWIITLANVGMYVLIKLEYPQPYFIWGITIPAWIYTMVRGFRREKTETAATHLDRVSGWLWFAFGICVFTVVAFGTKLNYQINPLILLITAIPTFVSGIILKFNPFKLGGVCFWVCAIIAFLVPMEMQFLVGAVAIVCGFLIPGYMLRYKKANG